MQYHGFFTRDYLVLENVRMERETSILEIGVGTGSLVESLKRKYSKYHGVDISCEMITALKSVYAGRPEVVFTCADACDQNFSLGEKFEVIVSMDTFEHVHIPSIFLSFIKKHLSTKGIVLLVYPNESEERHHGVSWVRSKNELIRMIDNNNLKVTKLFEVNKSIWHKAIKIFLWDIPKKLFIREDVKPQTFEETKAFNIFISKRKIVKILKLYSLVITRIATLFPLYIYGDVGEDIENKNLCICMEHK